MSGRALEVRCPVCHRLLFSLRHRNADALIEDHQRSGDCRPPEDGSEGEAVLDFDDDGAVRDVHSDGVAGFTDRM